jgi:hypothetical protein
MEIWENPSFWLLKEPFTPTIACSPVLVIAGVVTLPYK